MTDEPIFWADLLAKARSHRGRCARRAVARRRELRQELPERLPRARAFASSPRRRSRRPRRTSTRRCARCTKPRPSALVHCGFGFGIVFVNPALEALDWDPPRFTSTAFQNAWINPIMWNAFMGWTGVDQYDEGNPSGRTSSTSTPSDVRPPARVLRAGREPRRRHHAAARVRRRPPAEPARCQGGAGAGEDAARRLRRARAPGSRSASGPVAPGWAPATWSPASSTPTASTPISSTGSVRSMAMTTEQTRRRPKVLRPHAKKGSLKAAVVDRRRSWSFSC